MLAGAWRTDTATTRPSWVRPASGAAALAGWAGLVWLTHVWGERLVRRDHPARIFAAPLAGRFDPRWSWAFLFAIAIATVLVLIAPRGAAALRWRPLLLVAFGAAAAWAVTLAATDGAHALVGPLLTRWDYLVDVPLVRSPHSFLTGFVANAGAFSTHVRAHPPGMLLLLWGMNRMGLRGAVPE